MAETKSRISQELSPDELADFCAALSGVPHAEMAAAIMKMAAERGISIGRSAAYEFRNNEAMPFIKRLQMRRAKAEQLRQYAGEDDGSAKTLADFAAGELSQMAFDFVTTMDGQLDLDSKEGRSVFDTLTKGIARLRQGDRVMITQLTEQLAEAQAKADKAVQAVADSGASPQLVKTIRESLNFRPPTS